MTEIEQKALALLNECAGQEVYGGWKTFDPNQSPCTRALCRAIERHEAFRQEVSDAVEVSVKHFCQPSWTVGDRQKHIDLLSRFIIAKPDPLVDAWQMAFPGNHIEDARDECAKISAAIEKRGGKIVWGEG